jgi:hypothetical protein
MSNNERSTVRELRLLSDDELALVGGGAPFDPLEGVGFKLARLVINVWHWIKR